MRRTLALDYWPRLLDSQKHTDQHGDLIVNLSIKSNPNARNATEREAILANPGFGKNFTDHMFIMTWTPTAGWHDAQILPYGPLSLDPAASVLHYGQEIFEGLKAYRHADGSIWSFRPDANARRLQRSAKRLALPELPVDHFLASIKALVDADSAWVPPYSADGKENSLYLRPFMIATEAFLGVRPATEVKYLVIASPAGPYFAGGIKPVSIWLSSNFTRAAPGGTGSAKCGGNYAAGLAAQMEASAHGCDQVCFVDAEHRKYIEELGGMNLYFVYQDGTLVTPPTSGTILEGITRESLLTIAKSQGLKPVERPVTVEDWVDGVKSGKITEVFACGTAAVITPIGRLVWADGEVGSGQVGQITQNLRKGLLDIQYGRAADTNGWMTRLA